LSIISPDKSLFCSERGNIITGKDKNKFVNSDQVYQGTIAISDMQGNENTLTMYAITSDGKTWYIP
jgi:hypothetical protein